MKSGLEVDIEGNGWTDQTILLKNRSKAKIYASVSNDSFVNSLIGLTNNQFHCVSPGKNESWYRVRSGLLMKLMDGDMVESAKWHIQINRLSPGDVVVYGAGGRDSYKVYSKQQEYDKGQGGWARETILLKNRTGKALAARMATGTFEYGASGSYELKDGLNMSWTRLVPAKLWLNETVCLPVEPSGVYVVHDGLQVTKFINGLDLIPDSVDSDSILKVSKYKVKRLQRNSASKEITNMRIRIKLFTTNTKILRYLLKDCLAVIKLKANATKLPLDEGFEEFYSTLASLLAVLARFIEITGNLAEKCEEVEKMPKFSDDGETNHNGAANRNNATNHNGGILQQTEAKASTEIENDVYGLEQDAILTFEISPKSLDPVPSMRRPTHSSLFKFISEIPSSDDMLLSSTSFVDGLGGWEVFFELANKVMILLFDHLDSIILANMPDPFKVSDQPIDAKCAFPIALAVRAEVVALVHHLKHLNEILGLMVRSVREAIDEPEIDRMTEAITIPPFWYHYGEGLLLLKYVIETAKAATFRASRSREHEAGESHLTQLLSVGYHSVLHLSKAVIGATSANDFVELHRSSSIVTLKLFFNLPSDPICSMFTNLILPSIHTSITIWIPMIDLSIHPTTPFKHVSCQLLYPGPLPFELHERFRHPPTNLTSSRNARSPNLGLPLELDMILHFHGGGFVAGNPQFHESYTRDWSSQTKSLLISVDYSLAPEAKFPTALEECFYVYQWLVERNEWNITPRKIILAGDSAGGNLVLAVTLLAILKNIRVPDGLLAFYPVTNLIKSVVSSPSRVMFFHDVFVPIHFMFLCLDSYCPPANQVASTNYLMSPVYAPDWILSKFPDFIYLISAAYDPLLDDAVNFVRRLKKLFKNHYHQIYYLPHGFLNLALPQIPEAALAKSDSIKYLQTIFSS